MPLPPVDAFGQGLILTLFTVFRTWITTDLSVVANRIWNEFTVTALGAAVTAVTLWVVVNGYLIVSGASREPLLGFLFKAFRPFLFILLASGAAVFAANDPNCGQSAGQSADFRLCGVAAVVVGLRDTIGEGITGNGTSIWDQLNTALTGMGVVNAIAGLGLGIIANASPGADAGDGWVSFATAVAVGAPVITLSVTVLTLEAALVLGSALAPIFFFLGAFQRFADWPFSWIKFMFATIVSSSVMAALSVKALLVYTTFLGSAAAAFVAGMGLTTAVGVMAVGGILVSALMITIPSMVMRLFSLASEGAVRDVLGTGGGRAGGSDPRGKGTTDTGGGGGVDPRLYPSQYPSK